MSWEQFQGVFKDKYFINAVHSCNMEELMSPIQGTLTDAEYAQTFDRLARFAPDMVPIERPSRDKFI